MATAKKPTKKTTAKKKTTTPKKTAPKKAAPKKETTTPKTTTKKTTTPKKNANKKAPAKRPTATKQAPQVEKKAPVFTVILDDRNGVPFDSIYAAQNYAMEEGLIYGKTKYAVEIQRTDAEIERKLSLKRRENPSYKPTIFNSVSVAFKHQIGVIKKKNRTVKKIYYEYFKSLEDEDTKHESALVSFVSVLFF